MHITFDAARTALHEVVGAAGEDHRYEPPMGPATRCVNAHNGRAHCLVAKVLERLGVDVAGHCERHPEVTDSGVRSLVTSIGGLSFENGALEYLAAAQGMQDRTEASRAPVRRRPTWGWVRDRADEHARLRGWL